MKKSVFLSRLFSAYIFIVIVYTFIASSIYYYNRNELNQKKMHAQNIIFMEQARDKIDMRLMIAFDLMNQLKTNSDIIKYRQNIHKDYYNILQVYKQLQKHLDAFSRFEYQISVGKIKDNMIITPKCTIKANNYLNEEGFLNVDKEQIDEFFSNDDNPNQYIMQSKNYQQKDDSTDTFMYIKKEVVDKKMENILFLLLFNKKQLLPDLEGVNKDTFLVLENNQIIISTGNRLESKIVEDILSHEVLKNITSPTSEHTKYFKLQNQDYYVYAISSKVQFLPWKYVYITPKDIFYERTIKLIVRTVVIYLLLLLIGLILALIISRKIYSPINKMMCIFDKYTLSKATDQQEKNDEFSYIRKTVSKMDETNKELQHIIKTNQVPLKTQFLRELVDGILSKEQIKIGIDKYNLNDFKSKSIVVILEYLNDQELEDNISREAVLSIKKQIFLCIKKNILSSFRYELFELDYKRYVMLFQVERVAEIKKHLNELLSVIELEFKINMVAAIGKPVNSIYEIQNSFKDTLDILEYEFLWGHKLIITEDDLKTLKSETYYYPLDIERDLIDYVLKGKTTEVDSILNRILDENLTKRTLNSNILSQFIFAIVATSNRIMQKILTIDKQKNEERKIIYLELKMCKSKQQLKEKILDLFHELLSECIQQKEQKEHTAIDEIILFINKNYNVDLSLTDIAEEFNLSVGYAGILFKKSTGENFKDYLNNLKVKKSKEILKNEDIKIKDLAQRVGCNTTNTFIRMFRKYEGISPGKYKEKIKNI